MGTFKQHLGLRLRELRKIRKLSQIQLAVSLGCDPKTISRIESGTNYPSFDLLEKLATQLRVDIAEFFKFKHLQTQQSIKRELKSDIENLDETSTALIYKIIKAIQA